MSITTKDVLERASSAVTGARHDTHGPKMENHRNIADVWNAYLNGRLTKPIEPHEVAAMMVLLKVARTKLGSHNPDDYIDMAGYSAIAGELHGTLEDNRPPSGKTRKPKGSRPGLMP